MFPEKFHELEDKIRQTAELMAQLRQEKMQLEQKNQEAEKRIAELEGDIKRIRAERQPVSAPMDTLDSASEHAAGGCARASTASSDRNARQRAQQRQGALRIR